MNRSLRIGFGVSVFLFGLVALGRAENMVGVYEDAAGTIECTQSTGVVQCYLVLSDCSDPVGVTGWQMELRSSNGASMYSPNFPVSVLNMDAFPRMIVGCGTPIPTASKMVLMSFQLYSPDSSSIYIDQVSDGEPPAIVGVSSSDVVPLSYEYGGYGNPVFSAGGGVCPERNTDVGGGVLSATESWGRVKAAYR